MRTTLTVDEDVAARLREIQRRDGISFKEAVNTALRRGTSEDPSSPEPYRVRTTPLGVAPGFDIDKALSEIERVDDEAHGRRGR